MKLPNLAPSVSRTMSSSRLGDRGRPARVAGLGIGRVVARDEKSNTYECECYVGGILKGTATCLKTQTCAWNSATSMCDCQAR